MRTILVATAVVLCACIAVPVQAQAPCPNPVKIQSGTLFDAAGNPITVGYDKYGYNYQAHIFNGLYENYSRPAVVATDGTENLVMKWSDDWLANVSCTTDGKLARGYDAKAKTFSAVGTSRGWVTNHFEGDYEGSDGEMHHYTYFVKIAYVGPAQDPDPWAATRIWGLYAIIEELQNDQFGEYGGRLHFVSKLTGPGLGKY
jgi:hypothetical protein